MAKPLTKSTPPLPKAETAAPAEPSSPVVTTTPIPAPAEVQADPMASVSTAIAAVDRLYRDAGEVSEALSAHIRVVSGDPVLHARLHRMQTLLGGLRHELKTALLSNA